MVINDEAHHTHDEDSEWNNVIRRLHDGLLPKPAFSRPTCRTTGFHGHAALFQRRAFHLDGLAKLPEQFGFAVEYTDSKNNLRYYEPDFVAVTTDGKHYLVETKGRERCGCCQ